MARNRAWVAHSRPDPVPAPPARGLTVITCMDARIVPVDVFGLAPGEAHVLRNAGGRVTDDVLRSLAVSTYVYGVRAVAVVHHTECGMVQATQDELAALTGDAEVDYLTIPDARRALDDDVALVARSRLVAAGTAVGGFTYDVRTGVLSEDTPRRVCGGEDPPQTR